MISILNKSFRYVPAASTDIRKLFNKVRRELKEQAESDKRKPLATVAKLNRGVK